MSTIRAIWRRNGPTAVGSCKSAKQLTSKRPPHLGRMKPAELRQRKKILGSIRVFFGPGGGGHAPGARVARILFSQRQGQTGNRIADNHRFFVNIIKRDRATAPTAPRPWFGPSTLLLFSKPTSSRRGSPLPKKLLTLAKENSLFHQTPDRTNEYRCCRHKGRTTPQDMRASTVGSGSVDCG